jgi:hypothetical protein
MSWTTEGSCEFRQKDLRALQVNLESTGCNGLWTAPLWMTPKSWAFPQVQTGELDIFERGCKKEDGYLASFGADDKNIVRDAWGEQGTPNVDTKFTAFMTFDPLKDTVRFYKCPFGSSPMTVGTEKAACALTREYTSYYHDTKGQTNDGQEYMHFVSDVWNDWGKKINCKDVMTHTSDCAFKISGLQLQFSEESTASGKNPFSGSNAQGSCKALWYQGSSPQHSC